MDERIFYSYVERLGTEISRMGYDAKLHYWRTKAKEEVDIVVHTTERLLTIEVKSDKKIRSRHLKGLKSFLEKEKERVGVLIGRFEDIDILENGGTRIYLLPYWML